MMPFSQITAAPIIRNISGQDISFGRFTRRMYGQWEELVRKEVMKPYIDLASTTTDAATKQLLIKQAQEEGKQVDLKNLGNCPQLTTIYASQLFLFLSLKACDSSVTFEQACQVFDLISDTDLPDLISEIASRPSAEAGTSPKKTQ